MDATETFSAMGVGKTQSISSREIGYLAHTHPIMLCIPLVLIKYHYSVFTLTHVPYTRTVVYMRLSRTLQQVVPSRSQLS